MRAFFYFIGGLLGLFVLLIYGKFILAPLVLATLVAVLVNPLVEKLKSKLPTLASVLLVISTVYAALFAIFFIIFNQYVNLLEDLPVLKEKIYSIKPSLTEWTAESLQLPTNQVTKSAESLMSSLLELGYSWTPKLLVSISEFFTLLVILPIFTFFLSLYGEKIHAAIRQFIRNHGDELRNQESMIQDIKNAVQQYMMGLGIVMLSLATLNTLGLFLIGVKYAFLLGISAAILSAIPYVGNILGGGLAVLVALGTHDSVTPALLVVGLFVVVQVLEGNLITPKIMGDKIGVNPLVVILALMISGSIWGIVGMIIAIPLVATLRVILIHKPNLKPFVKLIDSDYE